MGLEELTRKMSKYYETHEMDIDYTPKNTKIPTFNQGKLPTSNLESQSNNPPSVQQPRGNALDIAKQVIAKQQTPAQMGIGFNKPQPIPQNPYAKKVSPLPYNPAALQKAQQIQQQAKGMTADDLRRQNLANIKRVGDEMAYDTTKKLQDFFEKPVQPKSVAGANAWAGLGQAGSGVAKTVDFILPDVITPKLVQNYLDRSKQLGDITTQQAAAVNKEHGVSDTVGSLIQGTVAAVPNAILAMISGGTSLGAQTIGQTSTGLIGSIGTSVRELARNPMFYSSLMQTAGSEYEQAKADGATELEATITAIISSIVNSGIEIGGGIEAVAKNPISLKNWVKGMLDEGKEEVLQGIISQAAAKATYDKDKEWVSATDENAVINPGRMAQEFAGGAVVGGVLGGGQMLAGKALGIPTEQDSYLPERGENATAAEMAGRLDINDPQPGKLPTITRREQRALDALSAKTGVNIQVDDDIKGSNGYFDHSTNTLHISRNSNNAVYQVAAHEISHALESNPEEWNQLYEIANANLSEDARSKLEYVLQKTGYTDAQMQSEIVSHYVQQCVTDIKSFEQLVGVSRTLAQRIVDAFESFVRKITGQRSVGGDSDTEYLREIMGDITPEQAQQALAQMKKALGNTTESGITAEPSVSHSLKGINQHGIEVYETSADVLAMSHKDRKKQYINLMKQDYAGRTARFTRNGHTYYAEFDDQNLSKPMYGETRGSDRGTKALVRAAADGDVFDLVENSKYHHSSKDTKNHDRTDYFDYFVKTVQIDGRVYDLQADVKKRYGVDGGYTYTLYLKDNKKIKPAPPAATTSGSVKLGSQTLSSGNNIQQNQSAVNNQNSLKLSPEEIKQNADTAEQYFGTTINPKIAGYLTVNGKMLDFSGKKFGAPGHSRTMDHREITNAFEEYGDGSYSGGMVQFMSEGNIRLSPESGGINLSVKPNKVQEDQLARYIRTFGGEVIVDFDHENGDIAGSVEYPARTPASLILQEIRDYFDKGKMPENFDYSRKLNREALQEMAQRSRTGVPYAPGYVPKTPAQPALPYNPNAPKPIPQNPAQGKFGSNTVGAAQPNVGSYANLQTEHGVVDPGENPARMIDMPVKDAQGRTNSLFARTVAESEHMPNEMVPEWEQAVASGEFSHDIATDKAALRRAEREIGKGWDHAMRQWNAVSEGARIATKDDLALGQLLLANAMKDGDTQTAMRLTAELCAEATRAGRAVQSFRLLKKMTPEGMLYYLQKTVNNLNEDFEGRKGFEGIKIDEGMAERLGKATTREEMDSIVEEIKHDIAAQTPVTWYDKWNAWRYVSMLGNPTTQVRNVLGNALFVPVVKAKNLIATGIEAAVKKTGHLPYATKAVLKAEDKNLVDFAEKDFANVVQEIQGGGKYSDKDDVLGKRRIFKSRFLEGWRNLTNTAMDKGDEIFSRHHYKSSLAQYMKANKLTPENITPEQLNKARNYAVLEAQRATYRDASSVASLINQTKRRLADTANNKDNDLAKRAAARTGELLIEGFVPFTKTPVNIVKRGIEYSPVGLVHGTVNLVRSVRGADVDAAAAIDRMAAGLTGSGLLALGAWLSSLGLVSGGPGEDDREEKYKGMLGEQDYALDLGDTTYTIDWLAPEALPFFTGVELYKEIQSKDGLSLADTLGLISAMSDPIVELSMLSSMNNTFESLKYTQGDALSTVVGNLITSYMSQGVPTIGGKIARTVDKTSRQTYYDPNKTGIIKSADVFRQKVQAKIPGAANGLTERVDLWGRTEENFGGNIAGRFFYNMLSPGYAEPQNVTKVDEELLRLAESTSDTNVYPDAADKTFKVEGETIKLNSKQYTQFAKTKGQTAFNILEAAVDSSTYKKMTDAEKAEFVKDVYEYANAKAKAEVSKYQLDGKNAKIAQAEKKGIKPAQYLTITGGYDKDGNGSVTQEEAKAVLDKSGLTMAQKAYMWKLQNKSWKNNPYN